MKSTIIKGSVSPVLVSASPDKKLRQPFVGAETMAGAPRRHGRYLLTVLLSVTVFAGSPWSVPATWAGEDKPVPPPPAILALQDAGQSGEATGSPDQGSTSPRQENIESGSGSEGTETSRAEPPRRDPKACVVPGDDLAPTMVVIPPGRFQMGSPDTEAGRDSDEGPRHGVTIPRPFALSRCEITVGQFRRFVREQGYVTTAEKQDSSDCFVLNAETKEFKEEKGANWRNPGFAQSDEHPVVCVSREDAQAYASWLSQRTGAAYRLPTEAEWEYAARAGTETARYWGDQPQCGFANGAGLEAKAIAGEGWTLADCRDPFVYTAPVASLEPNGFGLYDTAGNVWEWTADCWHEDYEGAPVDGTAWERGNDCGRRVIRGGSWFSDPAVLRSAFRGWSDPVDRDSYLGFRLAQDF